MRNREKKVQRIIEGSLYFLVGFIVVLVAVLWVAN